MPITYKIILYYTVKRVYLKPGHYIVRHLRDPRLNNTETICMGYKLYNLYTLLLAFHPCTPAVNGRHVLLHPLRSSRLAKLHANTPPKLQKLKNETNEN